MKTTTIPAGIRFHYWIYVPGCQCSECKEEGLDKSRIERHAWFTGSSGNKHETTAEVKFNPLVQLVIANLDCALNIKWPDERHIVVAEHRPTKAFAIAVLHDKDEKAKMYSKTLGRMIALGRLLKKHPDLKEKK